VYRAAVILLLFSVLVLSSLGIADVYIFLLPYLGQWPVVGDIIQWMIVIALFAGVCVVSNAAEKQFRKNPEL